MKLKEKFDVYEIDVNVLEQVIEALEGRFTKKINKLKKKLNQIQWTPKIQTAKKR